jgi:hypothetical protein
MSVAGNTESRAIAKERARRGEGVRASHPCHDAHRRDLRDDDEGGVDEDDDPDLGGADRCVGLHEWRQDVGEERVTEDDEHEVGRDHTEEDPIPSDGAKAGSDGVCRRGGHGSRARHGGEHDQRESRERGSVEEVEKLERAEPLRGGDDEAGHRRAGTDTEVAGDAVEREGGRSLLRRDQPDDQGPVGRPGRAEPGSAGNRAGKRLPRTVDEGETGIPEDARHASCNHERLGGVPVEQRSRRRRDDCGRPHGRRQDQSRRRRGKATYLVQVDDLERKNEPIPEVVERVSRLQDERGAREPGAPSRDEM